MLQNDEETDRSRSDDSKPDHEVRMTRFVLGELRRYIMLTVGLFFLITGAIVLPLPLPFGAAMILIGLSLLIVNSEFARAKFLDACALDAHGQLAAIGGASPAGSSAQGDHA